MLVTKFFRFSDWHYFESGTIKFGTLEEYGRIENREKMGARFDSEEGISRSNYKVNASNVEDISIQNFFRARDVNVISDLTISIANRRNDWIFCAVKGGYSEESHFSILEGVQDGYPGNRSLLAWAVFDLEILLKEIHRLAKYHGQFQVVHPEPFLIHREVSYVKLEKTREIISSKYTEDPDNMVKRYLDSIFEKPSLFAPENEHRIVLRMKAPFSAPTNALPIYLQSPGIRDSIVSFGPQW